MKLIFGQKPEPGPRKRRPLTDAAVERRTAQWMARKMEGKGPWKPSEMGTTRAQCRLLALLGLQAPTLYRHAASVLKKAGYMDNGIPFKMSWQRAAKLSDKELLERAKR